MKYKYDAQNEAIIDNLLVNLHDKKALREQMEFWFKSDLPDSMEEYLEVFSNRILPELLNPIVQELARLIRLSSGKE